MEVLLLCRHRDMKFIGGSWVFPGGAVDLADCRDGEERFGREPALRAAVRETHEEAGIEVQPSDLLPIAHWTAPKEAPRRYATWFFIADIDFATPVQVDGGEITGHRWFKPEDAISSRDQGEISFLPPTFITLQGLCEFSDTQSALAHYKQMNEIPHFNPRFVIRDKDICNLYEEDAAWLDGDIDKPGPRHRFWMKGKGPWKYQRSP